MFFLYYLDEYHPLMALFFQKFIPSLSLVAEFERIQNKDDLYNFYGKVINKIIPFTPYLDRVQIANFYIHIHRLDKKNAEAIQPLVKFFRLNEDWADDCSSLSGFMFFDDYNDTRISKIKKLCTQPSYYLHILLKNFYRKEAMTDFIMEQPELIQFMQDLRHQREEFKAKVAELNHGEEVA